MKAMIKLFGAAILAAAVTLAMSSCQKETNIETPAETTTSGIHVTVGAGIVDTKSDVVTDGNGVRTLVFTSGDKLSVYGSLTLDLGEGDASCMLSGELAVANIDTPATSATFEGDLKLYKLVGTPGGLSQEEVSYDFGQNNPLDLCTSAEALLVHEGTSVFPGSMPGPGRYFEQIASTVDDLMKTCLNVSGNYDTSSQSFSLSASGTNNSDDALPIFNCTISGLAANTPYEICLLFGENANDESGNMVLGGKSSDGMGQLTFACYASINSTKPYYYAFRFKNGNNWKRAELGTKQLESKVYNITRTASADPASPVMPTITGTQGTVKDLSIEYEGSSDVDVTISGTSASYYFKFNVPSATLHLDNLSASSSYGHSFIVSYSDMFIELSGTNSIITRGDNCIDAFGNKLWLSCSGGSATLTLTYDEGKSGINAGNSAALAAPGYGVDVTTVDNGDGTKTSTYTVTHTGLLNGLFTINAGGDKVRFSQGNLRYRKDDIYPGQGTWSFAPNQYSIIGNAENNTKSTVNAAINQSMDLFCWGATGLVEMVGDTPIYPDANTDPYYYNGNSNLSGSYEWGNVTISNTTLTNWRTLSEEEWEYLFSNNAKYGPATVAGCVGIVLLPDGFSDPSGAFKSVSNNATEYSHNVYSAENWKAMEYAGAVFLPAGGSYLGGSFDYYISADMGYYWTSTPNTNGNTKAYYFAFLRTVCEVRSGDTNSGESGVYRSSRLSVRLVRTAN